MHVGVKHDGCPAEFSTTHARDPHSSNRVNIGKIRCWYRPSVSRIIDVMLNNAMRGLL